jgi:hypothetical protein
VEKKRGRENDSDKRMHGVPFILKKHSHVTFKRLIME